MRVPSIFVSTRTQPPATSAGLSVTTLVIASLSSICAALVVHKFWTGGAILGAGLTPIIVAIVSESLKKPTQRITAIREERRSRSTGARRPGDRVPAAPAPPERERPDPFGIWQEERQRSSFHWVRGRALKLAVVTGLVAFAVAAIAVTGAELVFGGGDRGLTYVPGNQGRESRDRDEPTTTQPAETTETAPAEEQPAPTTPQPTTPEPVPTTPAPQTAPSTTTPAPETPAPTPQTPAPAPVPQG